MPVIECNGLVKRYGARQILNQLNLIVEPGEMVAVMGESGCGKTTLLNILSLVDSFDAGNYCILGHRNVKVRSKEALTLCKERMNCIFQKNHLMDKETVINNLRTALYCSTLSYGQQDREIRHMVHRLRLNGLEKTKVECLSSQERQRVAIARALLKPGDLIIADEPTVILDEQDELAVVALFKQLNQMGKTIVLGTHKKELASMASRVIYLSKTGE